jgi:hypothetical protein
MHLPRKTTRCSAPPADGDLGPMRLGRSKASAVIALVPALPATTFTLTPVCRLEGRRQWERCRGVCQQPHAPREMEKQPECSAISA